MLQTRHGARTNTQLVSALTVAATSPGTSYCAASIDGSQPYSRSVALVTGPIEQAFTPRNGMATSACFSSVAKFFTVDELVNVTASISYSPQPKSSRTFCSESA